MIETEVIVDDTWGLVLRKRGIEPHDHDRLSAEAQLLTQARRSGVADLLEHREATADGTSELLLRWVGTHTLDTVGALTPERAAVIFAQLADLLGSLHHDGIVHGRLRPEHVVIDTEGAPVLCGFAAGRGTPVPADDVAALGELLLTVLGADGGATDLVPDRRFGRGARQRGLTRRHLCMLADHASADDPQARPTADELSEAIRTTVPAPTTPTEHRRMGPGATARPVRVATKRNRRVAAIGAALAGAAGLAAIGVALLAPDPPEQRAASARRAPSSQPAPSPDPTVAAPGSAPTVRHQGATFELGEPGDQLTLGDWDCDGTATPAVLRPSSGEVFVFHSWASPTRELTVRPRTTVPRGIDVRTGAAGPDGCATLIVERTGADPISINPGAPR